MKHICVSKLTIIGSDNGLYINKSFPINEMFSHDLNNICFHHSNFKYLNCVVIDFTFTEPMSHNKPDVTYVVLSHLWLVSKTPFYWQTDPYDFKVLWRHDRVSLIFVFRANLATPYLFKSVFWHSTQKYHEILLLAHFPVYCVGIAFPAGCITCVFNEFFIFWTSKPTLFNVLFTMSFELTITFEVKFYQWVVIRCSSQDMQFWFFECGFWHMRNRYVH